MTSHVKAEIEKLEGGGLWWLQITAKVRGPEECHPQGITVERFGCCKTRKQARAVAKREATQIERAAKQLYQELQPPKGKRP